MNTDRPFVIVTADGSRHELALPAGTAGPAPHWLPRALGRPADPSWVLVPAGTDPSGAPKLLLARPTWAASDPRLHRLKLEWTGLQELNRDSDTVKAEVVKMAGGAPEVYRFTFHCRGIAGIDAARAPRFAEVHTCIATITHQFPAKPPQLRWESDIWHPNIHHQGRNVCINEIEWLASHTLVDLCRMLLEMVQYKNYHAELVPPFPLDREVAAWVLEVGEPQGHMNLKRRKGTDDKPFTRPTNAAPVAPAVPVEAPRPAIRFLTPPPASPPAPPPSASGSSIRIINPPR
ncbi:MAG TPA: ubiquitin-conjugating enzyme E2 [Gemmata sp.]